MGIIEGCNWAALSSDDHIQMRPGGREEVLEELSEDFPYLAVLSQHDRYHQRTVPWHWHQEIEMFYVLDGPVVYATPHERAVLSTGAAGFVNANVLHTTFAEGGRANVNLLVHEMRPRLLAEPGGRLWRTYVAPLVSAASIELATVSPSDPRGAELCEAMRRSFDTAARTEVGWELRIRDELSEIWLAFLELLQDRLTESAATSHGARDERLRTMIDHIGHHYSERLSVAEIAASAFSSERECHRTFRDALGITPHPVPARLSRSAGVPHARAHGDARRGHRGGVRPGKPEPLWTVVSRDHGLHAK